MMADIAALCILLGAMCLLCLPLSAFAAVCELMSAPPQVRRRNQRIVP